jgi:chemotaxis protein CheD
MKSIRLGIGELAATCEPNVELMIHALGSCVGVVMMDPAVRGIALDHVALPESTASPEHAQRLPGYFADTAIPAMLNALKQCGSRANGTELIVKLVGGAVFLDKQNVFNIGKRNVLALKKTLWQHGIGVMAEDVGGHTSRTVIVDTGDGRVRILSAEKGEWEI